MAGPTPKRGSHEEVEAPLPDCVKNPRRLYSRDGNKKANEEFCSSFALMFTAQVDFFSGRATIRTDNWLC